MPESDNQILSYGLIIFIALILCFPLQETAAQEWSEKPGDDGLPSGVFRNHVGLNEGLAWTEEMVEKSRRIGVKILRKDLNWKEVEKEKGIYGWSDIDRYMDACEQRGIKVILILGKTNLVYDPTPTIPIPGNYLWKPYAAYARAAVERYKDRDVIWELWNEPDVPHMHADMTPVQFIKNALGVMKIIRSVDSNATIAGPANGFAMRFHGNNWSNQVLSNLRRMDKLEEFWQNLNIWTGHEYDPQPPDHLMIDGKEMYELQREVLNAYGGGEIPYATGERGFTANPKPGQSYAFADNNRRRVSYYLRQNLWGIYKEPRGFIINYVTHDVYDSGKQVVGNPAGEALKLMLDLLGDFPFEKRIPYPDENVVLLAFAKGEERRYAVWNRVNKSVTLNLPVYATEAAFYTQEGEKTVKTFDEYVENVPVGEAPLFIVPLTP